MFMLMISGKFFYYQCSKILFKISYTTNDVL